MDNKEVLQRLLARAKQPVAEHTDNNSSGTEANSNVTASTRGERFAEMADVFVQEIARGGDRPDVGEVSFGNIYCVKTGQIIGKRDPRQIEMALEFYCVEKLEDLREFLAPNSTAIHWIKTDGKSLDRLMGYDPRGYFVYAISLLYRPFAEGFVGANRDGKLWRDYADEIKFNQSKIHLWHAVQGKDLRQLHLINERLAKFLAFFDMRSLSSLRRIPFLVDNLADFASEEIFSELPKMLEDAFLAASHALSASHLNFEKMTAAQRRTVALKASESSGGHSIFRAQNRKQNGVNSGMDLVQFESYLTRLGNELNFLDNLILEIEDETDTNEIADTPTAVDRYGMLSEKFKTSVINGRPTILKIPSNQEELREHLETRKANISTAERIKHNAHAIPINVPTNAIQGSKLSSILAKAKQAAAERKELEELEQAIAELEGN